MNEVEIFGFPGSTYVRTVQMVCEEKGIKHKLTPFEYGSESHFQIHPYGKMPGAKVGDVTLYESLAIASYIDEMFEGRSLHPSNPLDNALMLQWISSFIDYVYPDLVRSIAGNDNLGDKESEKAFDTLEKIDQSINGNNFLVGNELTLADLYLAPMYSFALAAIDGLNGKTENLKSLTAWQNNIFQRDSFKNTEV